jgi:L-lactate permease
MAKKKDKKKQKKQKQNKNKQTNKQTKTNYKAKPMIEHHQPYVIMTCLTVTECLYHR